MASRWRIGVFGRSRIETRQNEEWTIGSGTDFGTSRFAFTRRVVGNDCRSVELFSGNRFTSRFGEWIATKTNVDRRSKIGNSEIGRRLPGSRNRPIGSMLPITSRPLRDLLAGTRSQTTRRAFHPPVEHSEKMPEAWSNHDLAMRCLCSRSGDEFDKSKR